MAQAKRLQPPSKEPIARLRIVRPRVICGQIEHCYAAMALNAVLVPSLFTRRHPRSVSSA